MVINFLDWRTLEKKYQIQQMRYILFGAFLIPIILMLLISQIIKFKNNQLESIIENQSSSRLASENQKQIENSVTNKVQHLLDARKQYIALLKELEMIFQYHICFKQVNRSKDSITFEGNTLSSLQLTSLLKQWPSVNLFSQVKLEALTSQFNHQQFRFVAEEI